MKKHKLWQNTNGNKTQIVINQLLGQIQILEKPILLQNKKYDKPQIGTTTKMWQNTNGKKTQIAKKHKLGGNTKCGETQIVENLSCVEIQIVMEQFVV